MDRRHANSHDEPCKAFTPIPDAYFRAEKRLSITDFRDPYLQGAFDGPYLGLIDRGQVLLVTGREMLVDYSDAEYWHGGTASAVSERS